jgi:hypothetical protein
MTVYKPENCTDEAQFVYYCDLCGYSSNFSDYWWPGCYHWEKLNYTLCYDCLRILALHDKANGEASLMDEIKAHHTLNY